VNSYLSKGPRLVVDDAISRGDQQARRKQNHRNGRPSMQAWNDVLQPEQR